MVIVGIETARLDKEDLSLHLQLITNRYQSRDCGELPTQQ